MKKAFFLFFSLLSVSKLTYGEEASDACPDFSNTCDNSVSFSDWSDFDKYDNQYSEDTFSDSSAPDLEFFNADAMKDSWNILLADNSDNANVYAEHSDTSSHNISADMENIKSIKEGEVIICYSFEQLLSDAPGFLEQQNIAYGICCDSTVNAASNINTGSKILILYRKNDVNHSMIITDSDNIEQHIHKFTAQINELYSDSMAFSLHTQSSSNTLHTTFTISEDYHDTYTYGVNVDEATCSYMTTFSIDRIISVSNDDELTITAHTKVYPYFGEFFTTNWYRYGIFRNDNSSFIFTAYPRTDGTIELNNTVDISLSLSIPASISTSFDISFNAGNTLLAWIKDDGTNYGANFKNIQGVRGNNPDNSFEFTSAVTFSVKKSTSDFSFYYAQLFQNAIYNTGVNPSFMGNNWKIVTSDKIGLKPPAPSSVYIYDGLDYALVFDPEYYLNHNSDLYAAFGYNYSAAFSHFISHGMSEARIASSAFNVAAYRNRYSDLNAAFGDDWTLYYKHYIQHGCSEGRIGV